jgi:hypothetical protein
MKLMLSVPCGWSRCNFPVVSNTFIKLGTKICHCIPPHLCNISFPASRNAYLHGYHTKFWGVSNIAPLNLGPKNLVWNYLRRVLICCSDLCNLKGRFWTHHISTTYSNSIFVQCVVSVQNSFLPVYCVVTCSPIIYADLNIEWYLYLIRGSHCTAVEP